MIYFGNLFLIYYIHESKSLPNQEDNLFIYYKQFWIQAA